MIVTKSKEKDLIKDSEGENSRIVINTFVIPFCFYISQELLEREVEELKRQLIEERQNTRRWGSYQMTKYRQSVIIDFKLIS